MYRSLVFVILLACQQVAVAQTVPSDPHVIPSVIIAAATPGGAKPLLLSEVLDRAHRANPDLLAGSQHLLAVQAQEVTAGLRQNPSLVLGGQMLTLSPDSADGPNFYQAGVQRLFERGGKRQARLAGARATTALTGSQLADQQRQLDFAVQQTFARMLYAQAAFNIAQENLAGYRQTVELMKVRLDAGDIHRTDFDRVELQLVSFENDADNARLALLQSSMVLQTLLGVAKPDPAFAISGSLYPSPVNTSLEELRAQALANRPDLKAAQAQIDANSAAVKLAAANGTADPTLEGEYERSGHSNTVGASLNIPLRIFDRNQGEKQRAQYELESSRLALVAARNQVIADVDSAWASYQAALAQDARYRSKYLAEAAHVRDNLEFSYRNGNATLLDYLSALADYRQVNLSALNSNLQLLLAVAQLNAAVHMENIP